MGNMVFVYIFVLRVVGPNATLGKSGGMVGTEREVILELSTKKIYTRMRW